MHFHIIVMLNYFSYFYKVNLKIMEFMDKLCFKHLPPISIWESEKPVSLKYGIILLIKSIIIHYFGKIMVMD